MIGFAIDLFFLARLLVVLFVCLSKHLIRLLRPLPAWQACFEVYQAVDRQRAAQAERRAFHRKASHTRRQAERMRAQARALEAAANRTWRSAGLNPADFAYAFVCVCGGVDEGRVCVCVWMNAGWWDLFARTRSVR